MSINYRDSVDNNIQTIDIYDGTLGIQYSIPHTEYILNIETGELEIINVG